MNNDEQLKLQAFFDGELPENEARAVASWVARDGEAAALLGELRNTRKALSDFESELRLPESREFYWSKISREIERQIPAGELPSEVSLWSFFRRWLIPAGTLAGVALAMLLVVFEFGLLRHSANPTTEMAFGDAGAFTYRDYGNGTTLVWLPYPAEREIAQNAGR